MVMEDRDVRSILGSGSENIFDKVTIRVASPEIIRSWSRGEVKNPETINYRTFKPEKGGLFCEKIFGPTKDWECNCGKYKRIKHRGVVCDRCGVEVTQSKVRRERMGHIALAVPVTHIWFLKSSPSRMSNILGMTMREIERVIYYEDYVVIDPGPSRYKKKQLLDEAEYREAKEEFGKQLVAKIGAQAIKELLRIEDLDKLADELQEKIKKTKSQQTKAKLSKRIKIVEGFRKSGNKPEWMVLDVLPVIPPDLRPLVPLEGGRFATSDLNDLYRRVINRNNRLKAILDLKTPDVIIRNEKRMLQEAVDALLDNGRHGRPILGAGNRPLKSLSDMLKGKQGRFRQNLLGKRVDYSGRSVIVVGPELKLHQCGLPKKMALELFEPFIIKKLKEIGIVHTIKSAKKMIEKEDPEVWDILEEVIKGHPVLLNRAPTLHRLGIQAFEPVLIEGKAIRVHPLVCTAFNADFDGDQMAVHVPLSNEAQLEAKLIMLSPNNIFSPSSGQPITSPTQDIAIGCYYLTRGRRGSEVKGTMADQDEVILAWSTGNLQIHDRILFRLNGEMIDTTAGRVLFNQVLPDELGFVNHVMDKSSLAEVVIKSYRLAGHQRTVEMLDEMKRVGFEAATRAGLSISFDDMIVPEQKPKIIGIAKKQIEQVDRQYAEGAIASGERFNKIIDIWTHASMKVADEMYRSLEYDPRYGGFNPVFMMVDSGARGSKQQIRQLAGMRGLMAKPSGEIIEQPITSNFKEGLTVLEYFISTHGARKGLADTALKTADSGYLTRRLVDVAHDVIVIENDCGTLNGITVQGIYEGEDEIVSLSERIVGRTALEDIRDPKSKQSVVKAGEEITEDIASAIIELGVEKVRIRSVLTCESVNGVCKKCYGRDLSTGDLVERGTAVGIIAAQSIGEPGTQLTMRTFHIGGTASQIFKKPSIEAKNSGFVRYHELKTVETKEGSQIVLGKGGVVSVHETLLDKKKEIEGRELESYSIVMGAEIKVPDGGKVVKGETFIQWDPYNITIHSEISGRTEFYDIKEGVTMKKELAEKTGHTGRVIIEHREALHPTIVVRQGKDDYKAYPIPAGAHIIVQEGEDVAAGSPLAKTPRKSSKTKDITGGLPRVAELFEARRPKNASEIAKIDGVVEFGKSEKGKRLLIVHDPVSGIKEKHLIPIGKHLVVFKGDRVNKGQQLTEGPIVPQELLAVCGPKELQEYLVNQVQEVYRLQGVQINDKHIETIIRQMLRKVRIIDPGDTEFLIGEPAEKYRVNEENARAVKKGGKPATHEPLLLGITKSSLSTESFISAASFQETTRVLTDAAAMGRVDHLKGFKENVIMGHLIPAGTGFVENRRIEVRPVGLLEDVKEEAGEESDLESKEGS